ncbi:MAG: hypothetical protein MJ176_03175 [Treponema sp.]|nr:hypothetical protein [Treponema sp.]
MKNQPNRNYVSNDVVYTPESLAKALIDHFKPQGKGLEPCRGGGNIYKYLDNADYCEIQEGKDFFDYTQKVDYIFTNPPWSDIKRFLLHSYELAENIYMLITINHIWTKARLRDMKNNNFGIKEICIFNTPKEFPATGFQCGMVYFKKNYSGDIKFTEVEYA